MINCMWPQRKWESVSENSGTGYIVLSVRCIEIDAVETMARVNGRESEMKFHKAAQIHNQWAGSKFGNAEEFIQ